MAIVAKIKVTEQVWWHVLFHWMFQWIKKSTERPMMINVVMIKHGTVFDDQCKGWVILKRNSSQHRGYSACHAISLIMMLEAIQPSDKQFCWSLKPFIGPIWMKCNYYVHFLNLVIVRRSQHVASDSQQETKKSKVLRSYLNNSLDPGDLNPRWLRATTEVQFVSRSKWLKLIKLPACV